MKLVFLNDMIYDYAFQEERGTWATGGAERQQWMLARAMAAAGWKVTVGVRRAEMPPGRVVERDGVRFVAVGQEQVFLAWYRFFKSERADWWFWQCASHLFGFGVALAHLTGTKAIFGAGFDRDVHVRHALYHRPRWWPAYAFGLDRAECIALQHQGQREGLLAKWRTKAHVVPNIMTAAATVVPHGHRAPTVAWMAALRVQKRPDRLIEIARRLPGVRFIVCGGPSTYMTPAGYSEQAIEEFTSIPNIEYRGQVSPAEAVRITGESSILLSTSQEEGFPQTFLEAWAYGTPVVTLGIDPDSVITRHGLGEVCADVDSASAAVARLVGSAELRETLARNARQYVMRAHSPSAAVSALELALGQVASEPPVATAPEGMTAVR
jgi:glycosyltransferase involved in cell wall biosynthesis